MDEIDEIRVLRERVKRIESVVGVVGGVGGFAGGLVVGALIRAVGDFVRVVRPAVRAYVSNQSIQNKNQS